MHLWVAGERFKFPLAPPRRPKFSLSLCLSHPFFNPRNFDKQNTRLLLQSIDPFQISNLENQPPSSKIRFVIMASNAESSDERERSDSGSLDHHSPGNGGNSQRVSGKGPQLPKWQRLFSREIGHAAAETYLITRLSFKLLGYLG